MQKRSMILNYTIHFLGLVWVYPLLSLTIRIYELDNQFPQDYRYEWNIFKQDVKKNKDLSKKNYNRDPLPLWSVAIFWEHVLYIPVVNED